jgi:hemerythrin-like domain-containing protein
MKQDLNGPADTAMMGIVHDALRRDLRRVQEALADGPPADRRSPLATHITWMMDFLHAHHSGEDEGLYPIVRAANPGAAALLDAMDADHQAIHPAMAAVTATAQDWARAGSDHDRSALLGALDALADTLLPHLDREETDAMPVVAATLTHRQWHDWDQTFNIAPKSLPALAEEGNWLLDGLDARRRRIVLHQVSLIPRLIVLYVFGPQYRRHAAARWGPRAEHQPQRQSR